MTDQLMIDFSIGATELGNLSAFYFYSYVVMQIPTGIIADRWGPRRLLTAGALVAAIGSALFASAPDLWWANGGRLLIGASVAVAFVSMLKLASHWFAPQQFALASGLALVFGVVGGVIAGVPLRMLIEAWGWRSVMGVSAALTALLAVAIWLRVRDDPVDCAYDSHAHSAHGSGHHGSILRGMAEVLSYRNTWILLITPIGIAGSVLTFAGLWGVPYLRQVHGLDTHSAAAITSLLLIAWAVGGPVLGTLSQRMGRRRPLYIWTTAAALAGWLVVIFAPDTDLVADRHPAVHRPGLWQPDHRLRFRQGIGASPPDGHRVGSLQHGATTRRHVAATGRRLGTRRSWLGATGGWRPPLRRQRLSGRIQLMASCLVISLA
jgi:nitrate/nitrite transporter NarK